MQRTTQGSSRLTVSSGGMHKQLELSPRQKKEHRSSTKNAELNGLIREPVRSMRGIQTWAAFFRFDSALLFSIPWIRSLSRSVIFFLTPFFKNHIPSLTATLVLQIRWKSKRENRQPWQQQRRQLRKHPQRRPQRKRQRKSSPLARRIQLSLTGDATSVPRIIFGNKLNSKQLFRERDSHDKTPLDCR